MVTKKSDSRLKIKCGTCKKDFFYYDSAFRPFCSERCKMADLGHWLTETYAVPNSDTDRDEDDSPEENRDKVQEEE